MICNQWYQCITVRQRTARYRFVHYSALFWCTFSLFHWRNLYFFMLHFFHVALFPGCTFVRLHHFHVVLFRVVIFSYCTFFVLNSFYVLLYFMLHFYILQCFRFALFSCCTLCMLQFFPVALCSCSRISKMESFVAILNKFVKYYCKYLHLRCLWGPGYAFTFSMLHVVDTENYRKWTKNRKLNQITTLHLAPWTCFILFWYPITHFCHYIVLNGW